MIFLAGSILHDAWVVEQSHRAAFIITGDAQSFLLVAVDGIDLGSIGVRRPDPHHIEAEHAVIALPSDVGLVERGTELAGLHIPTTES